MLDIKLIRENPDLIRKTIKDKQLESTVDIDKLLDLDSDYIRLLKNVETHRALKNQLSEDISKLKGEGRGKLVEEATKVKGELVEMERGLREVKEKLDEMMLWIPNPPADDVPYGEDERGNVVARKEGEIPEFSFEPKDHMELGENLDIIDIERGTKIGGFRNYFLKNEGVELELAMLKFALDYMKNQGFTLLSVPLMVKPEYLVGTGYFPWGEEDHYKTQDGLGLVGTAEVSLTSYYADEVLNEEDLPVKLTAMSPCFRREVGSYGKDTKGIFRVHQFMKVEQVVLLPEGEELSREWHERMLGYSEDILKQLGLPYQVVNMCTGDIGAPQRKKYDINTWFPAQNKYRETHSDSYFLDYQSRRLNMKYKTKRGETKYVYTLNNTVLATPRALAALLENFQQKDGSVKIPQVLHKYLGFKEMRTKK